ncbi:MAG TPA: penicillin-binding protein 1C [Acidobacteriota bacterium]|nr:penicillin-binding protein 1C [Acidobacteriota bacterium]
MKRFLSNTRISKLALSVFAASAGLFLLWAILWPGSFVPPSFREVRKSRTRSEAVLLDRHGEVIHELRVDARGRRLDWIPLNEISPALQSAVIFTEDRQFYNHGGVSWVSLAGALRSLLGRSGPRGASTISMQLAARLDNGLRPRDHRRTLSQKLRQILAARSLEKRWSKAEIFEAYLNLVSFRGELEGIAAASRGLFRKEPQGLDDVESLILAALIRAPNAGVDQVGARACLLSERLKLSADESKIRSRTGEVLSRPYLVLPQASLAPHAALRLLDESRARRGTSADRLVSTLDARLQYFATEAVGRHLMALRSRNMHDAALLVVDNITGEVLAYVGNLGDQSSRRYVDGTQAMRQAGSTLKPFLYGLAFEKRLLTPASLLDDSPTDVPVAGGIYRPRNYDNTFHGIVTVRTALASSLNVPAVKALNLAGVEPFVGELRNLGFRNIRQADFYGPSLALGSADITLWDLVAAYRALANNGVWSPLRLSFDEDRRESRCVLSPQAVFLVDDILSDRESRSETFSLESPLSTRFWTAVKTGTSKDMRDNWCVGYSDRFTVGVWAGNFSGEPMWNVSGITGAAPVWVEIMNWLHRDRPSRPPAPPTGMVNSTVQIADTGQTRREWFIHGTETAVVREAATQTNFRIVYPAHETVIALDPDIPPAEQRVFFEATPEGNTLQWLLDGQLLGSAGSLLLWIPQTGKHTLALADDARHIHDSVNFEVRGNLAQYK